MYTWYDVWSHIHTITYNNCKSMDQPWSAEPGKRLVIFPCPSCSRLRIYLVSRDGFGSPVPRQLAHLHTIHTLRLNLVVLTVHTWDSSRVPRCRSFIYLRGIHYAILCGVCVLINVFVLFRLVVSVHGDIICKCTS